MQELTPALFRELAGEQGPFCVTAYYTLEKSWPQRKKDPIRTKNLYQAVRGELIKQIPDDPELLDEVLAPIENLEWPLQLPRRAKARVICLSLGKFYDFWVPIELKTFLHFGQRFFLKPLFELTQPIEFYVLRLSRGECRVFEGDWYGWQEVKVPDLPENIEDVAKYINRDPAMLKSTPKMNMGLGAGGGLGIAQIHGGENDLEGIALRDYLVQINQALTRGLPDKNKPLILATHTDIDGEFRKLSSHPYLHETTLPLGDTNENGDHLHDQALELFREEQHERIERDKDLFFHDQSAGRATTEVREVLKAARRGQIRVLFVANEDGPFGVFDDSSEEIQSREVGDGGEDLANRAAVEAFQNGATVHALPREQMPHQTILGADLY